MAPTVHARSENLLGAPLRPRADALPFCLRMAGANRCPYQHSPPAIRLRGLLLRLDIWIKTEEIRRIVLALERNESLIRFGTVRSPHVLAGLGADRVHVHPGMQGRPHVGVQASRPLHIALSRTRILPTREHE